MADHTIAADEQGVYELHLEAASLTTIQVDAQYGYLTGALRITHHAGNNPVYVRPNDTHVGDPKAIMIPPYTWADIPVGNLPNITLAIVSADTATVSVARQ